MFVTNGPTCRKGRNIPFDWWHGHMIRHGYPHVVFSVGSSRHSKRQIASKMYKVLCFTNNVVLCSGEWTEIPCYQFRDHTIGKFHGHVSSSRVLSTALRCNMWYFSKAVLLLCWKLLLMCHLALNAGPAHFCRGSIVISFTTNEDWGVS